MAQTSKAKSQAVQHAKTLVDQAENEAMEVDVVGVPERMELPLHLLDHTYSLYNPVNGERMLKLKIGPYKSNNIPPARVSFAPQVSYYEHCTCILYSTCICCVLHIIVNM